MRAAEQLLVSRVSSAQPLVTVEDAAVLTPSGQAAPARSLPAAARSPPAASAPRSPPPAAPLDPQPDAAIAKHHAKSRVRVTIVERNAAAANCRARAAAGYA